MRYYVKKTTTGRYGVYKDGATKPSKSFANQSEADAYCAKANFKEDKQTIATISKHSKNHKFLFFIILIILIAVTIGGIYLFYKNHDQDSSSSSSMSTPTALIDEDLEFHFLQLGNKFSGDSIFIKAGDKDILIDAGSRKGSASTIKTYLDKYVTDGKLEFVIATHAHQDHISGFVGTEKAPGILKSYEVETLIDFGNTVATSAIYSDYVALRDSLIEAGTNYYSQSDCFNHLNGATDTFNLTESISMKVLKNVYGDPDSEYKTKNENNFSVCTLFSQNGNNYLLTGDLEEDGEELLVANNELPRVKLFKAGHHGSYTASSENLLNVIQPEIVTVCCCAGSDEYTSVDANMFPSQAFIDRICKWTDKVYVTSIVSNNADGFEALNGDIVVAYKNQTISVTCSNNDTLLKDTQWFKDHRTCPKEWA